MNKELTKVYKVKLVLDKDADIYLAMLNYLKVSGYERSDECKIDCDIDIVDNKTVLYTATVTTNKGTYLYTFSVK